MTFDPNMPKDMLDLYHNSAKAVLSAARVLGCDPLDLAIALNDAKINQIIHVLAFYANRENYRFDENITDNDCTYDIPRVRKDEGVRARMLLRQFPRFSNIVVQDDP